MEGDILIEILLNALDYTTVPILLHSLYDFMNKLDKQTIFQLPPNYKKILNNRTLWKLIFDKLGFEFQHYYTAKDAYLYLKNSRYIKTKHLDIDLGKDKVCDSYEMWGKYIIVAYYDNAYITKVYNENCEEIKTLTGLVRYNGRYLVNDDILYVDNFETCEIIIYKLAEKIIDVHDTEKGPLFSCADNFMYDINGKMIMRIPPYYSFNKNGVIIGNRYEKFNGETKILKYATYLIQDMTCYQNYLIYTENNDYTVIFDIDKNEEIGQLINCVLPHNMQCSVIMDNDGKMYDIKYGYVGKVEKSEYCVVGRDGMTVYCF